MWKHFVGFLGYEKTRLFAFEIYWPLETQMYNSEQSAESCENLNFFFLSPFVYLFKNWSSQFLSHWESAESLFCSEELGSLPFKNQNKAWFSVLGGKAQIFTSFCWMFRIIHTYVFLPQRHLYTLPSTQVKVCFPIIESNCQNVNY